MKEKQKYLRISVTKVTGKGSVRGKNTKLEAVKAKRNVMSSWNKAHRGHGCPNTLIATVYIIM